MLVDKNIQRLAKVLNLTEKQAQSFTKRLRGWIKKNGDSDISIARGIATILKDLKTEPKEQKLLYLQNTKNPILLKYGKEILQLHSEGLGSRRIQKYLKEFHNARISHTTIHAFIKAQQEAKNG